MKSGVFYFIPANQIAGGAEPGSKDMKFMGHVSDQTEADPVTLQSISSLSAELCDQHLDVGRTMGIRRVILDTVETQAQGQQVSFVDLETAGHPEGSPGFSAWSARTTQGPGNAEYDGVVSLFQSLDPPTVFVTATAHAEFSHEQFLLLNLNYKARLVQTPAAKIKWTFTSKAAREQPGIYLAEDLGKVSFQTDEASWWVLDNIEPIPSSPNYTPAWLSQDLKAQIAGGCLNQRITLFFLPGGDSASFYPYISQFGRFALNAIVGAGALRDKADQRALYNIVGDDAHTGWLKLAEQFNYSPHTDPKFIWDGFPQPWLLTPERRYLGSLGLYSDFDALITAASGFTPKDIDRSATYLDEQGFPYTVGLVSLSPVEFIPPLPWNTQTSGVFEDHGFVYHALPPEVLPYGNPGNPDLDGAWRVRSQARTGRAIITQFKTTD